MVEKDYYSLQERSGCAFFFCCVYMIAIVITGVAGILGFVLFGQ